jgi:hypothetical protein
MRSLKKELVDMLVYLMQGYMALKMVLETEYKKRLKYNEERFRRGKQR